MNIKRISSLALLAALLLCLMAGSALADILVTYEGETPSSHGSGSGTITISKNATIEGSATGVSLVVDASVTELTLRDVIITSSDASALTFNGKAGDTLTLTLEGDNTLGSSNGYGIKASQQTGSTMIITGSGTLEAIGADKSGEREEGGHGIYVDGSLKITSTGSVTATGGAGTGNLGWGGTGIRTNKLEISGTGSVIATGGSRSTVGGMGMNIEATGGLSIENGSTVTVNAGEGPEENPALQTMGNIFVDSSTLTVNASQYYGIFLNSDIGSAEKLIVSGDSHVTVNSGSGAAVCFTNDGIKLAQIELKDAFVMRAGENKSSAAEINAYDQKYSYLSIEPVKPIEVPVPDSTNLPQTGDNSNIPLWSALAFVSLFGMTMLAFRRKTA